MQLKMELIQLVRCQANVFLKIISSCLFSCISDIDPRPTVQRKSKVRFQSGFHIHVEYDMVHLLVEEIQDEMIKIPQNM